MMRNPAKLKHIHAQYLSIALDATYDGTLDGTSGSAPLWGKASLPELIGRHAAVHPNGVAVVEQGPNSHREVTYGELENCSNQLARHLRLLGVEAEHAVGLYMERSVDYVLGALAILKAGGAYVPLDPASPVEHL